MAKQKYYAVKVGKMPGIYRTWDECKKQVDGYKGALYKSFIDEGEAKEYMCPSSMTKTIGIENNRTSGTHYDIYVDGSYFNKQYSWAFVVYDGSKVIHQASGKGEDSEAVAIHNVAGELEAAVNAIKWAEQQGVESTTIYHDYIGISEWATGRWKTNNKITQAYANFVRPYISWVDFSKVAGHSGVEGNELADKLAGEALKR